MTSLEPTPRPRFRGQGAGEASVSPDGWMRGARKLLSPNRDRRPEGEEPSLVVLHAISLPEGEYGTGYVEALFTNRLDPTAHPEFESLRGLRVSAHVLIDRSGAATQFVSFDDRAWHAGVSSFAGRSACNDFSIGIEMEGCEREPFTPSQYRGLLPLLTELAGRYRQISTHRIVGHSHIAPGRKTDPGPHFDWKRVRCLPGIE